MNRLLQLSQKQAVRAITALVVLFYVLIPQTGFCVCEGCDCDNKLLGQRNQVAAVENAEVSSCCCKIKVENKSCCRDKTTENKDQSNSSESCNCSCSDTKENPPTTQSATNITFSVAEDLKAQLETFVAFLPQPEVSVGSLFPVTVFDSPISRLPVRLHLLILVMIN